MDTEAAVLATLDEALVLNGRTKAFNAQTPLLGALPEFDSVAVVSLISALESRFGFEVDDEDLQAATFSTVGSVVAFVKRQLA